MTNDRLPAEYYFDEVRQRAAASIESFLRGMQGEPADRRTLLRTAVANILSAQFGVATGTIVSSNRKLRPVEIDGVLIHDQTHNSPLFQPTSPGIFPIETVLAVISRIETLNEAAHDDLTRAIAPLRQMASRGKFYQSYDVIAKPNGKIIANLRERRSDAPPRTYLIVKTLGWERADTAAKAIKDMLRQVDDGHLDGMLVLDRDWFLHQPDNKHRIEFATEYGAIRFVQKLVADLSIADAGTVSTMRYAPA